MTDRIDSLARKVADQMDDNYLRGVYGINPSLWDIAHAAARMAMVELNTQVSDSADGEGSASGQ